LVIYSNEFELGSAYVGSEMIKGLLQSTNFLTQFEQM